MRSAPDHADAAGWADQLADDLARLATLVAPSRDRRAVDLLGQVAWRLAGRDTHHVDAVVEAHAELQELLVASGDPAIGQALDDLLVGRLLSEGRWTDAEDVIERALTAWPALELSLIAKRAEISRRLQRWDACRRDLDRVDAALAHISRDDAWALQVEAGGVRAQLELAFGRLDFAALTLDDADRALDHGVTLHGSNEPWVLGLRIALAHARADLDLTAGHNELVVASHANLQGALGGNALPSTMRAQLALAHDGLELDDPTRAPQAASMLRELIDADDLAVSERALLAYRLGARLLLDGDVEACAALMPTVEALVAACGSGDVASAPPRDRANLRLLASRLARARVSDDATMTQHLAHIGDVFDELLDAWAATPVAPGGLGFLQWSSRQELLAELVTLRMTNSDNGADAALRDILRAQTQGTLSRRLDLATPSLADVRTAIGPENGVLVYVSAVQGGHLLALDSAGVIHATFGPQSELRQLARRAAHATTAHSQAARDLVHALFPAEVRTRVDTWTHTYVVGLDDLRDVTLETLPFGVDDDAPTIGQRVAISHLPSLPLATWLASRSTPVAATTVNGLALRVAAKPADDARARWPQLVALPFGNADHERLTTSFGTLTSPTTHALTPEELLASSWGDAQLLHVLCHGIWDSTNERPASLMLSPSEASPDGLIGSDRVESPQHPYPPLVILSACGAALGPPRAGDDGVAHLGGAFLRGGARAVLLADDDIDYHDTLRLMSLVHTHIADGESPAEALRRARSEVDTDLPLRLIGLGHQPLFAAHPNAGTLALPVMLAGAALVLGSLLLWTRRRRT